jgi:hypothetical protein
MSFPVLGGPTSSTPFGIRPPSFANRCASSANTVLPWKDFLRGVTTRERGSPFSGLRVRAFQLIEET